MIRCQGFEVSALEGGLEIFSLKHNRTIVFQDEEAARVRSLLLSATRAAVSVGAPLKRALVPVLESEFRR